MDEGNGEHAGYSGPGTRLHEILKSLRLRGKDYPVQKTHLRL